MHTEIIIQTVCEYSKIGRMELGGKVDGRQPQHIVEAKQIAAYLFWKYTTLSGDTIAEYIGYRSKQSVLDARKTIKEIMTGNHAFAEDLKSLETKILRD